MSFDQTPPMRYFLTLYAISAGALPATDKLTRLPESRAGRKTSMRCAAGWA
jgi:hypothetical protein